MAEDKLKEEKKNDKEVKKVEKVPEHTAYVCLRTCVAEVHGKRIFCEEGEVYSFTMDPGKHFEGATTHSVDFETVSEEALNESAAWNTSTLIDWADENLKLKLSVKMLRENLIKKFITSRDRHVEIK